MLPPKCENTLPHSLNNLKPRSDAKPILGFTVPEDYFGFFATYVLTILRPPHRSIGWQAEVLFRP
jgi:hypothetical protein